MKIRIKGNSIRFRLSKNEVTLFATEGYLEEKTVFPSGTFIYAIRKLFDGKTLDASFINPKLTLFVPRCLVQEWTTTDITGSKNMLPISDGENLNLLLEKDFECINAEEIKDQLDYYNHSVKNC